uniref:RING-type domain-containing protein n=1 Tax=Fusarium oxysporum (strain Fo5176) TaxID=660025 RepID=A0A0D2XEU8_FUSOF
MSSPKPLPEAFWPTIKKAIDKGSNTNSDNEVITPQCPICMELLPVRSFPTEGELDAEVLLCGHVLCQSCRKQYQHSDAGGRCPVCRTNLYCSRCKVNAIPITIPKNGEESSLPPTTLPECVQKNLCPDCVATVEFHRDVEKGVYEYDDESSLCYAWSWEYVATDEPMNSGLQVSPFERAGLRRVLHPIRSLDDPAQPGNANSPFDVQDGIARPSAATQTSEPARRYHDRALLDEESDDDMAWIGSSQREVQDDEMQAPDADADRLWYEFLEREGNSTPATAAAARPAGPRSLQEAFDYADANDILSLGGSIGGMPQQFRDYLARGSAIRPATGESPSPASGASHSSMDLDDSDEVSSNDQPVSER